MGCMPADSDRDVMFIYTRLGIFQCTFCSAVLMSKFCCYAQIMASNFRTHTC